MLMWVSDDKGGCIRRHVVQRDNAAGLVNVPSSSEMTSLSSLHSRSLFWFNAASRASACEAVTPGTMTHMSMYGSGWANSRLVSRTLVLRPAMRLVVTRSSPTPGHPTMERLSKVWRVSRGARRVSTMSASWVAWIGQLSNTSCEIGHCPKIQHATSSNGFPSNMRVLRRGRSANSVGRSVMAFMPTCRVSRERMRPMEAGSEVSPQPRTVSCRRRLLHSPKESGRLVNRREF
mmetsp:Transcript_64635/g.140783  ORF Transcript_64635/g.140783 Transcript_64635/m.140783 type:complete len:233 (-) Transcript_64635:103-801(-)